MRTSLKSGLAATALALTLAPTAARADAGAAARPTEVIVVTGTRTERRVEDAPVRIDVLGERAIERTGGRSLADVIEYLPGVYGENNCQNCNTVEVKLLGLGSAYSAILLDSRPLMSTLGEVYGLDQFAPIAVERIEVVKGGAGSLYGPDAVAGVINVLPHRPSENIVKASADLDVIEGEPQIVAGLLGERVWTGGSGLAYLQVERREPVDRDGDGFTEIGERTFSQAGATVRLTPSDADTLTFDISFLQEERRGGDLLDLPPHLASIAESIDTAFLTAGARVERQIDARLRLMAQAAIADVRRDSYYGGLGATPRAGAPGFDAAAFAAAVADAERLYAVTDNRVGFAEAQLDWMLGAHALTAGAQWRTETIKDRNIDLRGRLVGVLQDSEVTTLGVYAQDEWTVSPALTLILGLRGDDSSVLDAIVASPRLGALWRPTDALTVRANYSTGFRAPEAFSEDFHVDTLGADPVRVRNAAGLREERARTIALGFDWAVGATLSVDGQAYATTLEDSFVVGAVEALADGSLVQFRRNGAGARVAGAEANAVWRPSDSLTLQAGAALVDARFDQPEEVFAAPDGRTLAVRRFLKTPPWTGVATALWRATDALELNAALRYIGAMDVLRTTTGTLRRTDAFWVADLTATYTRTIAGRETRWRIGVKNLLDEYQPDLERGPDRDSDYVYGPRTPRTFTIGFSIGH